MNPYIKNWLLQNIPSTGTIIEAGTSDGTDTIEFVNIVKDGMVYAFEPIEELYNITKEKIKNYKNIKYIQAALSVNEGKKQMFVSLNGDQVWGSSSLLEPKEHLNAYNTISFDNTIDVDTINLDKFILENKIDVIDFMWLDLQGYEPLLLKNSPITLKRTKYIYTEVALIETYKNVILKPEFISFFKENFFDVIFEQDEQYEGNILLKNNLL
jgi:FkbM family methyltransferase